MGPVHPNRCDGQGDAMLMGSVESRKPGEAATCRRCCRFLIQIQFNFGHILALPLRAPRSQFVPQAALPKLRAITIQKIFVNFAVACRNSTHLSALDIKGPSVRWIGIGI
jgi:hypothetical protein